MTYPLNYTMTSESAAGNLIKGDVISSTALLGDDGTGTSLAPQLDRNQAYRLHKTLIACGALGQPIKIAVDVANTAKVTNAMSLEATVYENVPESVQIRYFDKKFGFGRGTPIRDRATEGSISRKETIFAATGDVAVLSGDSRFAYDPDVAAAGNNVTITPNGTDVIILREGARFAALGDTI